MFKKILTVSAVAVAVQMFAADTPAVSWKFPEAAEQWNNVRNLSIEKQQNEIALLPTKGDASISITKTDIAPEKYNTLRIYYRAEGFKALRTTGQLFFGTSASPKIVGTRRFILPTLITDGKPQVLTLDLTRQKDYQTWLTAGKITTLRLDMVDQYPGDIYISKIELLARNYDDSKLVWDFADGIGDWYLHEHLKMSWLNNALFYETTGKDSRIMNKLCKFAGKNYTKVRVVYRAEGFTGRTTGQIFFTSNKSKHFDWKRRRVLPALTVDGKTHEFTVQAPWGDEEVNALRLDMVDQHPGKIWIEKIELLP